MSDVAKLHIEPLLARRAARGMSHAGSRRVRSSALATGVEPIKTPTLGHGSGPVKPNWRAGQQAYGRFMYS
jgi:hypothetical protein